MLFCERVSWENDGRTGKDGQGSERSEGIAVYFDSPSGRKEGWRSVELYNKSYPA